MVYHPDVPKVEDVENLLDAHFDVGVLVGRLCSAINSAGSEVTDSVTLQQYLLEWIDHQNRLGVGFDQLRVYNEDTCEMELGYDTCVELLEMLYLR